MGPQTSHGESGDEGMLATSVTIGHDLVTRDLNGMFYIEAIDELIRIILSMEFSWSQCRLRSPDSAFRFFLVRMLCNHNNLND